MVMVMGKETSEMAHYVIWLGRENKWLPMDY